MADVPPLIPPPRAFALMRDVDELQEGIAAAITLFVKRGHSLETARKAAGLLLDQMENPRETYSLVQFVATTADDGTGETRTLLAKTLHQAGVITDAGRRRILKRLSDWRRNIARIGGINFERQRRMLDRVFDITDSIARPTRPADPKSR